MVTEESLEENHGKLLEGRGSSGSSQSIKSLGNKRRCPEEEWFGTGCSGILMDAVRVGASHKQHTPDPSAGLWAREWTVARGGPPATAAGTEAIAG
ncbi:hypothetical protein BaRGS_00008254 [Batillaria attramentaria]|uniref:Uncharacterized protein n=1 Tax=Batillaria attramentaria TaxID=370345 RepID=A0ABD0LLX0_9CAEN